MKRLGMIGVLAGLVFSSGSALAGDVMDFEAEVIEGEKKAPDVLLQIDTDASELAPVLYERRNFNDFHKYDRYYRPRLNEASRPARPASSQGSER